MRRTVARSALTGLTSAILMTAALVPAAAPGGEPTRSAAMVTIPGGVFRLGDVFAEGQASERPVHEVALSDYELGRFEVTVAEFRAFVDATGYRTRAERLDSREAQKARYEQLIAMVRAGERGAEFQALAAEFIQSGGCHFWRADAGRFDFSVDCNWTSPMFEQADDHPVVCLAWVDAASYCNWLSAAEGLPPAYDPETWELLDAAGQPTADVTAVRGYRLPTEAEWEYAARERGREVRFGNGRNAASSEEINFDATRGDHAFLVAGEYRGGTAPVGSYPPNALGLHDMSGNAWEWCTDAYAPYEEEARRDPVTTTGPVRVLRGGRFGGDAMEVRVFDRSPYESINRCNASGFRLARSR
jgi:formylglycine-generating enzyme required for sulfatase activity